MKRLLPSFAVLLAMTPAFAAAEVLHNDFDGDGRADLLWRNADTGANVIWRNGNPANSLHVDSAADSDWQIAGTGYFDFDFNFNPQADILWRHRVTGAMVIWPAADAVRAVTISIGYVGSSSFDQAGLETLANGNFGGAGILWRNRSTGSVYAGFNDYLTGYSHYYVFDCSPAVADLAWKVAGTGDFDGNGSSEILWRNDVTGANALWRYTAYGLDNSIVFSVTSLPIIRPTWQIAGVGDFNGDGRSDVLWHNPTTGANVSWPSANRALRQQLGSASTAWLPASIADLNGDHHSDIIWRNTVTGANVAWLSGNRATRLPLVRVTNQAWHIVP